MEKLNSVNELRFLVLFSFSLIDARKQQTGCNPAPAIPIKAL